ncbi:hypothetical protein MSAN_01891600 [Mycena sanguinolenta]|uniref:Uncharacterized protein n=1 Tax=Mycena sanguinolenta TaxID=230812 RepID=A0A8H6XRI9_9AGAR|nr:hypothetical protein MSAN_01891600 [Mycena sanguinolenta]
MACDFVENVDGPRDAPPAASPHPSCLTSICLRSRRFRRNGSTPSRRRTTIPPAKPMRTKWDSGKWKSVRHPASRHLDRAGSWKRGAIAESTECTRTARNARGPSHRTVGFPTHEKATIS